MGTLPRILGGAGWSHGTSREDPGPFEEGEGIKNNINDRASIASTRN